MKQILLVLRKDCRKFWPEILLSLAMTGAFIWISPYQWRPFDPSTQTGWLHLDWNHLQIVATVVDILLPVSWLILIARVVHGENLVGNRQFWVTRPYLWQLLLAEKLLFVAIFICVPFAIAQVCLLWRAGLSPAAYLPNLAFSLVLIIGIIVLPIFALATVTSSLLRMIGTLLAIVVILLGIAFIASTMPSKPSVSIPYSDRVTVPMMLAFCGAVLIAQYSVRKLWLSRALLVILLITIGILATRPFELPLLERIYQLPYPGHTNPVEVAFSPATIENLEITSWNDKVYLHIPIAISGLPSDDLLIADDIRVTIDAADGSHWTSPWQATYNSRFTADPAGSLTGKIQLDVDRSFFDRVQSGATTFHVAIAFTQLAAGQSSSIPFNPNRNFTVPKVGSCAYKSLDHDFYVDQSLRCEVAFHQPELSRVTTVRSPSPCDLSSPTQPGSHTVATWFAGPLHPDLADFGFSPVQAATISLPAYQHSRNYEADTSVVICPGSPVTVTTYRLVRRFQYQLDIPHLQLPRDPRSGESP